MKEIQLSKQGKNKGLYVALVDDDDYESVDQFRWFARKDKYTFYARRIIFINDKKRPQTMHEFIMGRKWIDHISHNGLDNQKRNLRPCNHQQNMMNQISHISCSSIFKGVCFRKDRNKWRADIRANGKRFGLGCFKNEIDAARAYNEKAKELHGEFACLNII